jgi:hypothetical protein
MLPILAPLISTLVSNGFNLLAGAVTAKGKEVIEAKLGISLEDASKSEDGLFKLRQLEFDHEEFLITAGQRKAELELDTLKEENKNTDSARTMNSNIQVSSNASFLAKNAAYILDFVVILSTIGLSVLLFSKELPTGNKEIAFNIRRFSYNVWNCVEFS